jgi:hypothetical protein
MAMLYKIEHKKLMMERFGERFEDDLYRPETPRHRWQNEWTTAKIWRRGQRSVLSVRPGWVGLAGKGYRLTVSLERQEWRAAYLLTRKGGRVPFLLNGQPCPSVDLGPAIALRREKILARLAVWEEEIREIRERLGVPLLWEWTGPKTEDRVPMEGDLL